MKTFLVLKNVQKRQLPLEFASCDLRYAETLVEHFLHEYTKPGDIVFDPFMGFGTTLVVAEKLSRVGFGIEYDQKRAAYVRSLLTKPEGALQGDATRLGELNLPEIDFSMTSPPYMGKHHKENPFTNYTSEFEGYMQYLETIEKSNIKKGGDSAPPLLISDCLTLISGFQSAEFHSVGKIYPNTLDV